jgi:hypothetical protein
MKTLVLIAAAGILFFGCKKDWTCECTTQTMPKADKETVSYTIRETSRLTASRACIHSQSTYTAATYNGTVMSTQTYTYDSYCELK